MAYDPTTKPGAWVRAQTERRERLIALGILAGLVALGIYIGLVLNHRVGVLAVLASGAIFLLIRGPLDRWVDEHLRMADGAAAEAAVGATLDGMRPDWTVMHDFLFGGEGNVDHLVSGPGGVFMVETKAHRYEDNQLTKSKRVAAKLHDRLEVWVTPVICIPGRKKVLKHNGVWIVPRAQIVDWLKAQHQPTLPFERLAKFADSL